jgi:hypothetical protein
MATASVEVSGQDAERLGESSRPHWWRQLSREAASRRSRWSRSADLVIAITGLVLSGAGTAKTILGWWHDRRPEGVSVTILLDDDTQDDFSGVDRRQLEIALARRTPSGH